VKPARNSLYLQVLAAVLLGAAVGFVFPTFGEALKPLGDVFVKLIKMLIAPIIFSTVALGISQMSDLKKVGRIGLKAVLYFEVMTTVALLLGVGVVSLVKPGAGLHARVESLDTSLLDKALAAPRPKGLVEHLTALVPETFVGAFTSGEVLQVLLLGVLFGIALVSLKEKAAPLIRGLEAISQGAFALVSVVMKLAPLGAFGAMAYTIGKFGVGALSNLLLLMVCFYGTSLLFVVVVLGSVLKRMDVSIFQLLRYLKNELLLVLGTSSSESALPLLMEKLEALGCGKEVVRLVVPTGYSFNLDGTCIYLTMASVFVAQALDVELSFGELLSLLLVLLLTSKGAAGVTGSGFVTLSATLSSVGTIPVAGLSLLFGIDRFMSEARALTNFMGNAAATIVVSNWEGAFDVKRATEILGAASIDAAVQREGRTG
jgi:aerobic C4-dicarboxylate transport protein